MKNENKPPIPVLNGAYGQAFTHLHLYGIQGIRNKCAVVTLSNEWCRSMGKSSWDKVMPGCFGFNSNTLVSID